MLWQKTLNLSKLDFFFFFQERTVTIRRQTVGGFGLSIKVG